MNGIGALACFLQAHDCALRAMGDVPQVLFSAQAVPLWWLASAMWFVCALVFGGRAIGRWAGRNIGARQ
jgi:hypothetical protein